jgi:hypothetical protein
VSLITQESAPIALSLFKVRQSFAVSAGAACLPGISRNAHFAQKE